MMGILLLLIFSFHFFLLVVPNPVSSLIFFERLCFLWDFCNWINNGVEFMKVSPALTRPDWDVYFCLCGWKIEPIWHSPRVSMKKGKLIVNVRSHGSVKLLNKLIILRHESRCSCGRPRRFIHPLSLITKVFFCARLRLLFAASSAVVSVSRRLWMERN